MANESAKVKQDLTNLERALTKLKGEIKTMNSQSEPLMRQAADGVVPAARLNRQSISPVGEKEV
jgi:hypothetical protein